MSINHEPLEFNTVNAEAIDDRYLERLYVHNNANGNSTLFRMAHMEKNFLLIADRGMGRTHILKLMRKRLNDRNNIVVDISNYSNSVEHTYYQLKDQFRDIPLTLLWELAILEICCVKLLGAAFYPRGHERLTTLLYQYFASYQPTELNNSRLFWENQFRTNREMGLLSEVNFTIKILWGEFTTGFKRNAARIAVPPPASFRDRYQLVSDWFWKTVQMLQSQTNFRYKQQAENGFPPVRSVYVIADGLDQEPAEEDRKTVFPRPISSEDLNGLVGAVKRLDTLSVERLKGGKRNFETILSIRAITYSMSVKHKDLTLIRANFEYLKWDEICLKNMMAQFIREFSKEKVEGDNDTVLRRVFPDNVHYFGKKFESGADFIIEYTEKRPREILLLWRECTSAAGNDDDIYITPLTGQNLVDGLKKYSSKALPDDISNEYELEFPGIGPLLTAMAKNYTIIPRVISKEKLLNAISASIKIIDSKDRAPWLNHPTEDSGMANAHVINILYQTGIIGIPLGDLIDQDWPRAKYSIEKTDLGGIESASQLVIRPAFWNHLTSIDSEITKKRHYIRGLFIELRLFTERFEHMLEVAKTDTKNFEYTLARFLALCDMVDSFHGHPEPADWSVWNTVNERISSIYTHLLNSPLYSNRTELNRMIEFSKKMTVSADYSGSASETLFIELSKKMMFGVDYSGSASETLFIDLHTFTERMAQDADYPRVSRSVQRWLRDGQNHEEYQQIKGLRSSLIKEESLLEVLGQSKDQIASLLQGEQK